jgi:iron complex outermembrane receptor protein
VTPAYGVRWDVTPSLVLRGRLTKGFKAPDYTQLYNVVGSFTNQYNAIYGDPLYNCATDTNWTGPLLPSCNARGGGYYAALTTAPNPDLKPQTSTQQSFSATWKPEGFLRGLSLDVLYNRTRIRNQFASLADLTQFMTTAESYKLAEFHIRNADGRIIESQNKIFNITGSEFSSLTINGSYLIGTDIGTFQPQLTYVKNIKAETQGFPDTAAVSTLGRLNGADRYKLTGSVGWYFHDISAQVWAYHTPSYVNDYVVDTFNGIELNPDLAKPVRAYTTIDLTASWRVNNAFRINFAGRNIFDATPPFVVVGSRPYDVTRYNPAGRTLSLEAQFTF